MPTKEELLDPRIRQSFLNWLGGPDGEIFLAGCSPKQARQVAELEAFVHTLSAAQAARFGEVRWFAKTT